MKYKRILLKVSGEVLAPKNGFGLDFKSIKIFAEEIAEIYKMGAEVALVIGGGNIFRGRYVEKGEIGKAVADYMGMTATIINALAIQDVLENKKFIQTRVQSSLIIQQIAEAYIRRKAIRHLEKRRVVILAAGSGNPYFTTDTAAALRALELNCDVIFKTTQADGVYDSDPNKNKNAKKYDNLTFKQAWKRNLGVMDSTAFTLCMENKMPIMVFGFKRGNIKKAILGKEKIGTIIK